MMENFWAFAVTGLLLNLTPGNDMLFVIARSTGQGIKAGIVSALGIMAGCMVHIIAAMIGLSALLSQSATAFNIIKFAGAVYLIYLGAKSLFIRKKLKPMETERGNYSLKNTFWQGVVTNVLNPKVALFFLAFLPQFINPHRGNAALQILFLGTWFDAVGTIVNILVALFFGKIGAWLFRSPAFVQWQERITAILLIALGIKVALSSKK
ncbi:MAG: LysE family translocator [Bacteroidota bacterium]|nr:LysE family translocator [Flavisolibacter sp.]MDQ3845749.1 LysE family translocator [Bacteroidota bacterium]MBD0296092.1 LysE family translocator [Flavisolibacter sp.]MBD0350304.1 LysE family translocator [Flavisolibacter sp.]MBD0365921.1 LysE family translocator [Flavisolibacter sp.]